MVPRDVVEDPSSAALWVICEMSVVMEGVMVMMVAEVFIVFFFYRGGS